jgi:transposase
MGGHPWFRLQGGGLEVDVLVDRCAGLDVHKDTVMAVVRRPSTDGSGREQEVRQYRTFTSALRELRSWLLAERVTQVAMEATGSYWTPVWHVLEAEDGYELLLCNPRHVKNLPGRKTDVSDAAWLAQLAECGLLRGSFVPTPVMARLRDLTRYAKKLTEERTREIQRVQRVLEDAGIKLDSVASDVLGKSARAMLEALIAGERDPAVLADFAQTRMRVKIPELRLALEGGFSAHHALMLRTLLDHIDHLTAAIERLDAQVEVEVAPFSTSVDLLCTIPGLGPRTAWVFLAEAGADMSRFPTAAHLASWAGLCPGNHESAGKRPSGRARKGDTALRTAMVEAAWAATRARSTYLGAQYQRFRRRFGRGGETKAIFAVAHTMLVMAWHVLAQQEPYEELGIDYFTRREDPEAHARRLARELEKLGFDVTLQPHAA